MEKFFLKSSTIWGAIITIVFSAIATIGIDVPEAIQTEIKGIIFEFLNDKSSIIAMVGGMISVIGRFVATTPITLTIGKK